MNITEFLEARITEDEVRANYYGPLAMGTARILAECAAKRAILELHSPADYRGIGMKSPNACNICGKDVGMHDWEWDKNSFPCGTIRALAAVYKGHPDCQEEWAA